MVVFVFGGWMVVQGSIMVGIFVVFWVCLILLVWLVCDLVGMLIIVQQVCVGVVWVFEFIDSWLMLVDGIKLLLLEVWLLLEFQWVFFGYVVDCFVFCEISLLVWVGEILVVVGVLGSGKFMLVLLVMCCYDVIQGVVWIGGQDVCELMFDLLWLVIGLVFEDVVLFFGMIGVNIVYGCLDVMFEQIVMVVWVVYIEEFVNILLDGYQMVVGVCGLMLFGG